MEHPHSDYWNFFLLAPARQRADRPPQADFQLVWGVCSSLAASPSWAVPQCSQKCPFSVNFAPKWLEILIYAACNYGLCRQQRFGENLETPKPFACIWSSVEVRWQSPDRNQSRCCENATEAGHLSMFWRTHSFSYQPQFYCKSFYSQCLNRRAPCLLPSPWFARPNPSPSCENWPPVPPSVHGSKLSSFKGMRSQAEAWGVADNGP